MNPELFPFFALSYGASNLLASTAVRRDTGYKPTKLQKKVAAKNKKRRKISKQSRRANR